MREETTKYRRASCRRMPHIFGFKVFRMATIGPGIYQHTNGAYVRVFGIAKYQERDIVVFENMQGIMMATPSEEFFGVEGIPGDRFRLVRKIEVFGRPLANLIDDIIIERISNHANDNPDLRPG